MNNEKNLTQEREERTEPVVKEILELLLKHDCRYNEIGYILTRVETSLAGAIKECNKILYKCEDQFVTMKMIDDILKDGDNSKK